MTPEDPPSAAARRPELVSRRTREAVRDWMSGTTLREIDELWQDELFPPVFEDPSPVGGERVTHFQGYLNQVDWTDPGHVARALRVFEAALGFVFAPRDGWIPPPERVDRLRRLFARDGYEWTSEGKIVGGQAFVHPELLSNLTDASVVRQHLDRISRAVQHDDPAQAIGSAKELIESTAKLVLLERGVTVTGSEDVPELVKRAQETLLIHPTQVVGSPDAASGIRKILGASSTIALGVAELRNAGYGTGHGQGALAAGLGHRHARLVINSARTWCEFILDTLSDPRAPWRGVDDGDSGTATEHNGQTQATP